MTQPIDRETVIRFAQASGIHCFDEQIVAKISNVVKLAVAHSRKDAEPVDIRAAMKKAFNLGQTYWQQADSDYISQQNKSDATKAKFDALLEETVINAAHPPEADKLLQEARADALQSLERVPLTRSQKNRIWSSCSGAKTLPARASLFGTKLEAHHNITPPESKG